MCGGLEFPGKAEPGALGLVAPAPVRVLFPNPKAALLVDPRRDLWLPWGRRAEQPGDWPEGGWARVESLEKRFWTRWAPVPFVLRPLRWMEKDPARRSHWFALPEQDGILCLRLEGAPGSPAYVVTEPSTGDWVDLHDRIPLIRSRDILREAFGAPTD